MDKRQKYTTIVLLNLLMMLLPFRICGQDNKSSHSLYAGAGFGNNMIYMGSEVSQDKPFYYGSITYGFKDELFFSVSGNHLSAFDKALSFSTFSLSYNHDFKKWFDISLSASRYQVNSELTDTLFNSFFYSNIVLS